MPKFVFNIPNLLSFYRIAAVPVLTLFFFVEKAFPGLGAMATWINVFIYFCACISDYLDGVIARSPDYFTSLCGVCLRQRRQNFFSSSRSGVVLRFLVLE